MYKILVPILFFASCGSAEKAVEEIEKEELTYNTQQPLPEEFETMFKTVDAKVIKEPFVNQGGHKIEGVFDFFLNFEDKNWFIKFSSGDVLRDDLEKLVNKTAKFSISIHDGLWDTDDPMMQSRVGKYIAIHQIIE